MERLVCCFCVEARASHRFCIVRGFCVGGDGHKDVSCLLLSTRAYVHPGASRRAMHVSSSAAYGR